MKKILMLLVVPILAVMLYWFFYTFNASFKDITYENNYDILVKNEEEVKRIDIEDYVLGVVSCEMPALYHVEALKAQAIAARTYAYYLLETNNKIVLTDTTDQCYFSEEDRKDKWGNDYEKYNELLKSIVFSTKYLVMRKNNKLFKSFYFSTSNGYTEDSISVFKVNGLESVSSLWDIDSKNYLRITSFDINDIKKILGDFKQIKILKRDVHNHVLMVSVDDKIYTGINFRKKLNLRSTDFDIDIYDNKLDITTRGYGHGVGMSQNGANYLANHGNNYKYILNYYYKDITIDKY